MDLGIDLELVQSSDREDNIYVRGSVPAEILSSCQPNIPANLPDTLKAKIVDPKSFEDVPIIDLSGDEAGLVEQIRYACEVVGFMQVTGHGISEELQAKHLDLQKKFFELPQSVKERLKLCDESPVRGYFGLGGEDLDQVLEKQVDEANGKDTIRKARKDLKEALDCNGVPFARPVGGYIAEIFAQPSQLPTEEELAGFREVLDEYASEMFRLSKRLLELMALALEKPRDFFEQHLTQPVATHRLLHYWPLKDYETEIGVGEHTDYGLLTVLKQDLVGGLQVLNAKDGRWIHCCPVKNAFVINLGDMLSRWTAHRFKSTVHRVVTTSASERYSVPYFLEPNMDTIIQPEARCCATSGFLEPLKVVSGISLCSFRYHVSVSFIFRALRHGFTQLFVEAHFRF
ncbi:hxnY [Symbiodinium sp. KB8]|nr:hxnY [Symbiodinium sp. KB8]